MKLIFTKQLLLNSLARCITAYYPHSNDWYIDNDPAREYKDHYKGCCENYIDCDEWERFDCGIEQGFFWRGVLQNSKVVGLCIRGTDDIVTWALNFAAGKTDIPTKNNKPYGECTETGIEVHSGFHAGWLEIMKKWFSYLERSIAKGYNTVVIEGHSRGAAIAQDAAAGTHKIFCEQNNLIKNDSINVILFAPPNIFNFAGKVSYDKRVPNTIRIVNGTDPVCKVPPKGMGFYSVGNEMRIGYEWYSVLSPMEWIPNILGAIPFLPLQAIGVAVSAISANDHYPTQYRKNISTYNGIIPNAPNIVPF